MYIAFKIYFRPLYYLYASCPYFHLLTFGNLYLTYDYTFKDYIIFYLLYIHIKHQTYSVFQLRKCSQLLVSRAFVISLLWIKFYFASSFDLKHIFKCKKMKERLFFLYKTGSCFRPSSLKPIIYLILVNWPDISYRYNGTVGRMWHKPIVRMSRIQFHPLSRRKSPLVVYSVWLKSRGEKLLKSWAPVFTSWFDEM